MHFQAIFPSSSCGSCLILPSLLPTSMNSLEVPDIHTLWNTVITMIKSEHKKLCHWGCGRKAGNYRSINFKKMRFRGRRRRRNREELFVVKSLSCKVTQTWLEYEQANPPAHMDQQDLLETVALYLSNTRTSTNCRPVFKQQHICVWYVWNTTIRAWRMVEVLDYVLTKPTSS